MAQIFDDAACQEGAYVTLHDANGCLLGASRVYSRSSTQIALHRFGWRFLRSTGKEVGGARLARPATAEQYAAAEAEFASRAQAKQDAARKAAYDALPEAVKLARTLAALCDRTPETKLAQAPIEHLRGMVEWARANGLETE